MQLAKTYQEHNSPGTLSIPGGEEELYIVTRKYSTFCSCYFERSVVGISTPSSTLLPDMGEFQFELNDPLQLQQTFRVLCVSVAYIARNSSQHTY